MQKTVMRKRVIIETPYAGNVDHNIDYARACMADSLLRDEAPIASHLIYTQPGILDDRIPKERKAGIESGFAWWEAAELIVFYTDLGWSNGMKAAWDRLGKANISFTMRTLKSD